MKVLVEMSNLKFATPKATRVAEKLLYKNTVLYFEECSYKCYTEQVSVPTYALLL
jgi:hypothetical protein